MPQQSPWLLYIVMAMSVVAQPFTMRGGTYCEILWGAPAITDGMLTVSWNGTGGTCPENPGFFNVTTQDVKDVHGEEEATTVIWNGMWAWTLDMFTPQGNDENATTTEAPTTYEYGSMFPIGSGLIMRKAATLQVSTSQGPCKATEVARFQTALWRANTTVFELISPDCEHIYTMQSVYL